MRIIDTILRSWLHQERRSEQPHGVRSNSAQPMASGILEPNEADLPSKLRSIIAQQGRATAGSIHLLGLDSLKDRLGERWPTVADKVRQLAARLLHQSLHATDAWFPYGEDAYVVVFASLRRDEAQLICAKIVEELQRLLLGDVDTESIVVRSLVHEIGGEIAFEPACLKDMLAQVVALERSEQRGAVSQGVSGDVDASTEQTCEPSWYMDYHDDDQPLEVLYRPIWDTRKEVLSHYVVRPMRPRDGRLPAWGYDCIKFSDPKAMLDLDLSVLQSVVETYTELFRNKFRFFVVIPVHFETLAVQSRRREYLRFAQATPPHLAHYLLYQVVGLPVGIPVGRLSELVNALRPFGSGVVALAEPARVDITTFAASGLHAINCLLPPAADPIRWRSSLARIGIASSKSKIRTFFEGVNSAEMIELALEIGADYVCGDVVGSWTEFPQHVLRLPKSDLLIRRYQATSGTGPLAAPGTRPPKVIGHFR